MAESKTTVTIVPLSGKNYPTWKVQCRMALMRENLVLNVFHLISMINTLLVKTELTLEIIDVSGSSIALSCW